MRTFDPHRCRSTLTYHWRCGCGHLTQDRKSRLRSDLDLVRHDYEKHGGFLAALRGALELISWY